MIVEGEGTRPSGLQALIDAAPLSALQIHVVLLCTLVSVTEGIDLTMIPLLAPAIAKAWALPSGAFGAIFAAGPIGLIVGGFAMGYFADRYGRRASLIGAMVLMTAATLATVWIHTVPEMLVCRIVTGIGFGGVIPASTALVSEFLATKRRASVVAFVILGQNLGAVVAAFLARQMLGTHDWQGIILLTGGICAATTVLLVFALPESPRYLLLRHPGGAKIAAMLGKLGIASVPSAEGERAEGGRRGSVIELFRHGRALGTCLLWATFIGVCAEVSFFTNWLTLIYTYAGKPAAIGMTAIGVYSAGGVVSGLVVPLFCPRFTVIRVLMACALIGAASVAALGMVLSGSDALNMAVVFACGLFVPGAFYLVYPPAVGFYPTAIRSTGVGAAVAFGRIGNVISPAAAGAMLSAGIGPHMVFWVMAVPMLLTFAAIGLFRRLVVA
ncbi:MFS transporter [Sphingomonas sp. MMS24-J13]|uniref:MFS transporter n=1 Tax=Sphingomonas sp. MMS24-J13 TaxID=3238686 RepID=UPI00384DF54E